MRRNLLSLLLTFFSLVLMAQSTARKFVVNVTSGGESTLTCFLPAFEKATGRAVVVCPGGAYWNLAIEHEGYDWAEFFNAQGIACCVLKYRLPHGDRSKPIADAENAIKMARDSASSWGLNPHDVGIMGSSAGGHLASTVSTLADDAHRPDFSILFYPVISMDAQKGHAGSAKNFLGKDVGLKHIVRHYSNAYNVRRHATPPAILLLADDDVVVPPVTNAVAYYAQMRTKGNSCSLHIYPSGGHGFGFKRSFKYHDEMLKDLSSWLQSLPSYAQDAVRVACIGNSITDGMGIDMSESFGYPARLQTLLGKEYRVKNFGVSATTLLRKGNLPYVEKLAWKEALAFLPNKVVLMLGTNDSKSRNWQYKDDFKTDLQAMVDTLKSLPSKPQIYLAYPLKAPSVIKSDMSINGRVIAEEIIPILNKVAKKNKLRVINLRDALDKKALMNADGVHPNAKGALVMAQEVAKAIAD